MQKRRLPHAHVWRMRVWQVIRRRLVPWRCCLISHRPSRLPLVCLPILALDSALSQEGLVCGWC